MRSSLSSVAKILSSFVSSVFFLAACSGVGALETRVPEEGEAAKAKRHPDGVVLEPPPAMPPLSDRASATGVVALREPLADKDVEDMVRAYLRAFEREDMTALEQMTAHDAVPLGRAGGTRAQLVETWRTKIKNFEYQKLAGLEVARFSQIEKYVFDALNVPGAPTRPPEMKPGDVYVRVPILTPQIGTERLFGDVVALLLRREDGRLKLAGQADEQAN